MAWPNDYKTGSPRLWMLSQLQGGWNTFRYGTDYLSIEDYVADNPTTENSVLIIPSTITTIDVVGNVSLGTHRIIAAEDPENKPVINFTTDTQGGFESGENGGIMDLEINFSTSFSDVNKPTAAVLYTSQSAWPAVGCVIGNVSCSGTVSGVVGFADGGIGVVPYINGEAIMSIDCAIGAGTWNIGANLSIGFMSWIAVDGDLRIYNSTVNNASLAYGATFLIFGDHYDGNLIFTNGVFQSSTNGQILVYPYLGTPYLVSSIDNCLIGQDVETAANGYELLATDGTGVDMGGDSVLPYTTDIYDVEFDEEWDHGCYKYVGSIPPVTGRPKALLITH